MSQWLLGLGKAALLILCLALAPDTLSATRATWIGVLRDLNGKALSDATVKLSSVTGAPEYSVQTSAVGTFVFSEIVAGKYEISVIANESLSKSANLVRVQDGEKLANGLTLLGQGKLAIVAPQEDSAPQASGGERLSSVEVSSLPLNTRDFSKLLLLSAGTMTDANGAANFTQQFAINGQRGTTTVFALDGADTTDPEMGGATFSNFNVDAI